MDPTIRIIAFQRGFVAVGVYSKEGSDVVLKNASIVRRWGTTKGLGQIAPTGPTENTVLDRCGTVRTHELSVVLSIDCNADAWAKHVADQA